MTPKYGFFGGSFDPIHHGHLNLAVEICEKHNLKGIFFCPTSQSPHKKNNPPVASKEARRAMVAAAIAPFPLFTLIDLELQKTSYCYTIDTIRTLISLDEQTHIKRAYHLILGEDAFEKLHTWRESDELVKLAPPLVGERKLKISSTTIRSRLQQRLDCTDLLPPKVYAYIQEHKLYEK